MQKKLYKELWNLRFQKMLVLEEQSAQDYEDILKECAKLKAVETVKEKLKQLIADETRHAKYVRELIKIVNRQED